MPPPPTGGRPGTIQKRPGATAKAQAFLNQAVNAAMAPPTLPLPTAPAPSATPRPPGGSPGGPVQPGAPASPVPVAPGTADDGITSQFEYALDNAVNGLGWLYGQAKARYWDSFVQLMYQAGTITERLWLTNEYAGGAAVRAAETYAGTGYPADISADVALGLTLMDLVDKNPYEPPDPVEARRYVASVTARAERFTDFITNEDGTVNWERAVGNGISFDPNMTLLEKINNGRGITGLGWTFAVHPDRVEPFIEAVEGGGPRGMQEAILQYEDIWAELVLGTVFDITNWLPNDVVRFMFPQGAILVKGAEQALQTAGAAVRATSRIELAMARNANEAVERFSKMQPEFWALQQALRSRVTSYGDGIGTILSQMAAKHDPVVDPRSAKAFWQQILIEARAGNMEGALSRLDTPEQYGIREVAERLADGGLTDLDDILDRWGVFAEVIGTNRRGQRITNKVLQGIDDPMVIAHYIKSAAVAKFSEGLGMKIEARGSLGRMWDYISKLMKELWLGPNPAFHMRNAHGNWSNTVAGGYLPDPFGVATNRAVARIFDEYDVVIPENTIRGFISDTLGLTEGDSGTAVGRIPLLGSLEETASTLEALTGKPFKAWLQKVPGLMGQSTQAKILRHLNFAGLVKGSRNVGNWIEKTARANIWVQAFNHRFEQELRPELMQLGMSLEALPHDFRQAIGNPALIKSIRDLDAWARTYKATEIPTQDLGSYPYQSETPLAATLLEEVSTELRTTQFAFKDQPDSPNFASQVNAIFDRAERAAARLKADYDASVQKLTETPIEALGNQVQPGADSVIDWWMAQEGRAARFAANGVEVVANEVSIFVTHTRELTEEAIGDLTQLANDLIKYGAPPGLVVTVEGPDNQLFTTTLQLLGAQGPVRPELLERGRLGLPPVSPKERDLELQEQVERPALPVVFRPEYLKTQLEAYLAGDQATNAIIDSYVREISQQEGVQPEDLALSLLDQLEQEGGLNTVTELLAEHYSQSTGAEKSVGMRITGETTVSEAKKLRRDYLDTVKRLANLTDEELKVVETIVDEMSTYWAEQTGRPIKEWFQRYGVVKASGPADLMQTAEQTRKAIRTAVTRRETITLSEADDKFASRITELAREVAGIESPEVVQRFEYDGNEGLILFEYAGDEPILLLTTKTGTIIKKTFNVTEVTDSTLTDWFVDELESQYDVQATSFEPYYSKLEKAIQSPKVPNRASGQQILGTLLKQGAKKEELDWTGIGQFLEANKGRPITREELAEVFNAGRIEIRDVVYGQPDDMELAAARGPVERNEDFMDQEPQNERERALATIDEIENQPIDFVEYEPESQAHRRLVGNELQPRGTLIARLRLQVEVNDYNAVVIAWNTPRTNFYTGELWIEGEMSRQFPNRDMDLAQLRAAVRQEIQAYAEAMRQGVEETLGAGTRGAGDTQFGDYWLPGGEDYREWIYEIPTPELGEQTRTRRDPTGAVHVDFGPEWRPVTRPNLEGDEEILRINGQEVLRAETEDFDARLIPQENGQYTFHVTKTGESVGHGPGTGTDIPVVSRQNVSIEEGQQLLRDLIQRGKDETGRPWEKRPFNDPHFYRQNVIMHSRHDTRYTPDGKKVHFLGEAQSQFHQQGQKWGYLTAEDTKVVRAQIEERNKSVDETAKQLQRALFPATDWLDPDDPGFMQPGLDHMGRRRAYSIHETEIRHTAERYVNQRNWGEQVPDTFEEYLARELERNSYGASTAALRDRLLQPGAWGLAVKLGNHIVSINDMQRRLEMAPPPAPWAKSWEPLLLRRQLYAAAQNGAEYLALPTLKEVKIIEQWPEQHAAKAGPGIKRFYEEKLVNILNDIGKRYGAKVEKISIAQVRKPINPRFKWHEWTPERGREREWYAYENDEQTSYAVVAGDNEWTLLDGDEPVGSFPSVDQAKNFLETWVPHQGPEMWNRLGGKGTVIYIEEGDKAWWMAYYNVGHESDDLGAYDTLGEAVNAVEQHGPATYDWVERFDEDGLRAWEIGDFGRVEEITVTGTGRREHPVYQTLTAYATTARGSAWAEGPIFDSLEEAMASFEAPGSAVNALKITEEMRRQILEEGVQLFQKNKSGQVLGGTQLLPNGKAIQTLLQGADLSTVLEELGHATVDALPDWAKQRVEEAYTAAHPKDPFRKGEWNELRAAVRSGTQSNKQLSKLRRIEEWYVDGQRKFYTSGSAPNQRLATIWDSLRNLLQNIIGRLKKYFKQDLPDSMREVYESLFRKDPVGEAAAPRAPPASETYNPTERALVYDPGSNRLASGEVHHVAWTKLGQATDEENSVLASRLDDGRIMLGTDDAAEAFGDYKKVVLQKFAQALLAAGEPPTTQIVDPISNEWMTVQELALKGSSSTTKRVPRVEEWDPAKRMELAKFRTPEEEYPPAQASGLETRPEDYEPGEWNPLERLQMENPQPRLTPEMEQTLATPARPTMIGEFLLDPDMRFVGGLDSEAPDQGILQGFGVHDIQKLEKQNRLDKIIGITKNPGEPILLHSFAYPALTGPQARMGLQVLVAQGLPLDTPVKVNGQVATLRQWTSNEFSFTDAGDVLAAGKPDRVTADGTEIWPLITHPKESGSSVFVEPSIRKSASFRAALKKAEGIILAVKLDGSIVWSDAAEFHREMMYSTGTDYSMYYGQASQHANGTWVYGGQEQGAELLARFLQVNEVAGATPVNFITNAAGDWNADSTNYVGSLKDWLGPRLGDGEQIVWYDAAQQQRASMLLKSEEDFGLLMSELSAWRQNAQEKMARGAGYRKQQQGERAKFEEQYKRLKAAWAEALYKASMWAAAEVNRILFDYAFFRNWEEVLRYYTPFTTYQLRNPLFWAQVFMQRPGLLNLWYRYQLETDQLRKQSNLTARFQESLPLPGQDMAQRYGMLPEGYWAFKPGEAIGPSSQLTGAFQGEEPPVATNAFQQMAQEAIKVMGYFGIRPWPWIQELETRMGLRGQPLRGDLFGPVQMLPIVGPVLDKLQNALGLGPTQANEDLVMYATNRRIAEMEAEGTITHSEALRAQFNPSHPRWQEAQQYVQGIEDLRRYASWGGPYPLQFASPGEMALREVSSRPVQQRYAGEFEQTNLHPELRTYNRLFDTPESRAQELQALDINEKYDAMLAARPGLNAFDEEYQAIQRQRGAELAALYANNTYDSTHYRGGEPRLRVLRQLELMEPDPNDYKKAQSGEIDWEAYNAALDEFVQNIAVLSDDMGYRIAPSTYERFRNRFRPPEELARIYDDMRASEGFELMEKLDDPDSPEFKALMSEFLQRQFWEDLNDPDMTDDLALQRMHDSAQYIRENGLPYEVRQAALEPFTYDRPAAAYMDVIIRDRPELADDYYSRQKLLQDLSGMTAPGMFGHPDAGEEMRGNILNYYNSLFPQQRRWMATIAGVPESVDFTDYIQRLSGSQLRLLTQRLERQSVVRPSPGAGPTTEPLLNLKNFDKPLARPAIEKDLARDFWLFDQANEKYAIGQGPKPEWTPLMEKYYGKPDAPPARFWALYNEHVFNQTIFDDPVLAAIISTDAREVLKYTDEQYEAALKYLQQNLANYINQELTQQRQNHPEWWEKAIEEQATYRGQSDPSLERLQSEYFGMDFDAQEAWREANPDKWNQLRDYINVRRQLASTLPYYSYFFRNDDFEDWYGEVDPVTGAAQGLTGTVREFKGPTPRDPYPSFFSQDLKEAANQNPGWYSQAQAQLEEYRAAQRPEMAAVQEHYFSLSGEQRKAWQRANAGQWNALQAYWDQLRALAQRLPYYAYFYRNDDFRYWWGSITPDQVTGAPTGSNSSSNSGGSNVPPPPPPPTATPPPSTPEPTPPPGDGGGGSLPTPPPFPTLPPPPAAVDTRNTRTLGFLPPELR